MSYPETRRVDQRDTYHGIEVADPYRWLEADVRSSPEVAAWVDAQNAYTRSVLDALPGRGYVAGRLEALMDRPRIGSPFKAGGRYYHYRAEAGQEQAALMMCERLGEPWRVLLDPNQWSGDGSVALSTLSFSEDGRYVAYATTESGSDWQTVRVMEILSRRVLSHRLDWVKCWSMPWAHDGSGFYYTRHPEPAPGQAFQALSVDQRLYFHRPGQPQTEDELVLERPDQPLWSFSPILSDRDDTLVVSVYVDSPSNNLLLVRPAGEADFRPLTPHFEGRHSYLGNDGRTFYLQTTRGAPMQRVVAVDLDRPEPEHWRTVVPESSPLLSAALFGDRLVLQYLERCLPVVRIRRLDGGLEREVSFPGIGTLGVHSSSFQGHRDHRETFYTFSGPLIPPTLYRYDLETGESSPIASAPVDADLSAYEVEPTHCTSRDGTRVPIFLIRPSGARPDGSRPALVTGYGGFNLPVPASFSPVHLAWLELGGVVAITNLRGGSELGEDWHRAGMLHNKQNVFDDFIAAAEHLVSTGWAAPGRVAAYGGSNGGLLVGAVLLQRPDLYGACLVINGVLDMLRYHRFTAGKYWVGEYGSSEDPDQLQTLLAYSPLHNVREGVRYPPTMVLTADTDDRVVPAHSFKFAAALQRVAEQTGQDALLRVSRGAGHGAGNALRHVIAQWTDSLVFLMHHLEIPAPDTP